MWSNPVTEFFPRTILLHQIVRISIGLSDPGITRKQLKKTYSHAAV